MSAYMVDKDHIDFLVQSAIAGATDSQGWDAPHGGFTWYHDGTRYAVKAHLNEPERVSAYSVEIPPSTLGQRLADTNADSIHARYPDTVDDPSAMPGPLEPYWEPYVFEPVDTGRQVYSISAGLKVAVQPIASTAIVAAQLAHYEYQACEHDGWRDCEMYAFVGAMRERLLAKLPGAEAASWGFKRPEVAA